MKSSTLFLTVIFIAFVVLVAVNVPSVAVSKSDTSQNDTITNTISYPDTMRAPFGYAYQIKEGSKLHYYSDCQYIKGKQYNTVTTDKGDICKKCMDRHYKYEVETQTDK